MASFDDGAEFIPVRTALVMLIAFVVASWVGFVTYWGSGNVGVALAALATSGLAATKMSNKFIRRI